MKGVFLALLVIFSMYSQASGGVYISKTRVIFPSNKNSVGLTVNNNSSSNISLLRSWVSKDKTDENDESVFAVTPPLYRLESNSKTQLRINLIDDSNLPKDRESIFYINVLSIPSIDSKNKNVESGVQVAISHKMKLFYRPTSLDNEINIKKSHENLIFKQINGELIIENPSPYYITLSELTLNNKKHPNNGDMMLPPYGNLILDIKTKKGDKIKYKTINDYGGVNNGRETYLI